MVHMMFRLYSSLQYTSQISTQKERKREKTRKEKVDARATVRKTAFFHTHPLMPFPREWKGKRKLFPLLFKGDPFGMLILGDWRRERDRESHGGERSNPKKQCIWHTCPMLPLVFARSEKRERQRQRDAVHLLHAYVILIGMVEGRALNEPFLSCCLRKCVQPVLEMIIIIEKAFMWKTHLKVTKVKNSYARPTCGFKGYARRWAILRPYFHFPGQSELIKLFPRQEIQNDLSILMLWIR